MGKPPDDWAIPLMEGDELQSWKELAKRLRVQLRKVFAAKSTEATRPHYAGYSFREALALALDGGTIPLAYWVRDRHEQLTAHDWRFVAMAVWALQQSPPKQKPGPWLIASSKVEDAEALAVAIVRWQREAWCLRHRNRFGKSRQRIPPAETEKIIEQAIAQVKAANGVRVSSDRIWDLLRMGRGKGHRSRR